jgi:hypothetical protein
VLQNKQSIEALSINFGRGKHGRTARLTATNGVPIFVVWAVSGDTGIVASWDELIPEGFDR